MSTLRLLTMKVTVFGVLTAFFSLVLLVASMSNLAHAARARSGAYYSAGESHSAGGQEILFDISFHHVRDVKADGLTDNAARASIGGMFTSWLGLDLQGLYEMNSKAYMVGADFRLVPTDWFFLKAGFGGYASSDSHDLKAAPLGGAGIMARFTHDFYLVTEATFFQIQDRNNIGFGAGLGVMF